MSFDGTPNYAADYPLTFRVAYCVFYFGLRPHISRPDIFLLVMDVLLYCYFSFYVIPSHIIKEL